MSNAEIDPDTGLPKLPKGDYWKVEKTYSRVYPYQIAWVTRKWGVIPVERGSAMFYDRTELAESAFRAYRRAEDKRMEEEDQENLVGRYPPKKLKG